MSNKKILIVEDDADVRRGYRVLLKAHDYDTVVAGDGVAAVAEALKHLPDLIILDLGLPAGDGFAMLDRFRASPNLEIIPVVVVSGRDVYGILGNRERALQAGAKAYLQKPWDDAELLGIIDGLLSKPVPVVAHWRAPA